MSGASAATGSIQKIEGSCNGGLVNGTPVSFTYYSDYNGCQKISKSAVTFTSGFEGLFTGNRKFKNGKDLYSFPKHGLSFANSTGNTSGELRYTDEANTRQVITVQCEVRDYEYSECD
jgi:hypothetical protein